MTLLDHPLDSIQDYVSFFSEQELPVLRQSMRSFEEMHTRQDSLHARQITAMVEADPLFAAHLMRWTAAQREPEQSHDITTLGRTIMMMGIAPFFRSFAQRPIVEEQLASRPQDLVEVLRIFAWTRRATHLTRELATLRHDVNAEEVALATLLRPLCDILLWLFAPALAQRIHEHIRAHPGERSIVAEHAVLGCSERDILLALFHAWRFPERLQQLLDNANGSNPRVRTAALATAFSRHYAREGWGSPALPVTIKELNELLPIARDQLLDRLAVPHEVRERWAAIEEND